MHPVAGTWLAAEYEARSTTSVMTITLSLVSVSLTLAYFSTSFQNSWFEWVKPVSSSLMFCDYLRSCFGDILLSRKETAVHRLLELTRPPKPSKMQACRAVVRQGPRCLGRPRVSQPQLSCCGVAAPVSTIFVLIFV